MNALFIAVVPKFDPLVVHARQSDRAVVDLLAVHCKRLQFFIRTEVMKTPVNNREIILFYFFLLFFFIGFLNILTDRRKIFCSFSY